MLLKRRQARLEKLRAQGAADVAALLAGPEAVVVQRDLHEPPVSESGRRRPATAARVRVAGLDGRKLIDVTIRLVGPRAKWVPESAVEKSDGVARIRPVLRGKRLIAWAEEELSGLRELDPEGGYPGARDAEPWGTLLLDREIDPGYLERRSARRASSPSVMVRLLAQQWRGQLDPVTRELVPCVAPGSPDRTALLLRRIAESAR
ncbi:hypothetical protein [Amycolatopsis coloradensis]|uniref:hypothetical protein n=1 Tax=Amycolatopsis coloradensis TaxID=76021 RepID=UPI001177D052|nr:hypothetical protein [Amycolatopsis coloradensis]